MSWATAGSSVFRQLVADMLTNTTNVDLDTNTIRAALYNNTTAPDPDVSAANSAYNADQWVTANEVYDESWIQTGEPLTGKSVDVATTQVIMFDAANTPSSGSTADLANVYGCLVYDDQATTVANQGVCFNYFGGANSVTNGTFTIQWNANGVLRFTV